MAPKIGFIGIIGEMWKEDPQGTLEWLQGLGIDGMEGGAAVAHAFGVTPAQGRQNCCRNWRTRLWQRWSSRARWHQTRSALS